MAAMNFIGQPGGFYEASETRIGKKYSSLFQSVGLAVLMDGFPSAAGTIRKPAFIKELPTISYVVNPLFVE